MVRLTGLEQILRPAPVIDCCGLNGDPRDQRKHEFVLQYSCTVSTFVVSKAPFFPFCKPMHTALCVLSLV